MRISYAAATLLLATLARDSFAFISTPRGVIGTAAFQRQALNRLAVTASTTSAPEAETVSPDETDNIKDTTLEWKEIQKLTYRKLQKHLKARNLDTLGTTAALQARLHEACGGECVIDGGKAIGVCADEQVAQVRLQVHNMILSNLLCPRKSLTMVVSFHVVLSLTHKYLHTIVALHPHRPLQKEFRS